MNPRVVVQELSLRRPRPLRPKFIAESMELSPPPPGVLPLTKLQRGPQRSLGLLVDAATGTATTAWLVSPRVILTAGHCLCRPEEPRVSRSFYFAWQYCRGRGGHWSRVLRAATLSGWSEERDHRYDLAVALLDQAFPIRVAPPQPLYETYQGPGLILGYAFGGDFAWQASSPAMHCHRLGGRAEATLSEGSSGGPWLAQREGRWVTVGITSRGGEGLLLSPAWGSGLVQLLKWAGLESD